MYGIDAIMPLELEILSLCVSLRVLINDDTSHANSLNQIDFLDECQLKALEHLQAYQKFFYQSSIIRMLFLVPLT